MKKLSVTFVISACILCALTASNADAQYNNPSQSQMGEFRICLLGSWLIPIGDLDDIAEDGWGGSFSLGRMVSPNAEAKFMISYHDFGTEKYTSRGDINGGFVPIDLGGTVYLGMPGGLRPYLSGYGGWYIATGDFNDSRFGLGGSFGLDIPLGNPGMSLQIEPAYRIVFREYADQYFLINVGLAFGG